MIHLSAPDFVVIFLYFGGVLFVGYRSARKTRSTEEDFLLAGRTLTLPIFIMTLVSTWYGGILGVGEFSYRWGIANWTTQGVPYYFFAAVFAMFLAKRIRATNFYTIPDKLESSYDKKTAVLGSILTFILMTPAPYILMLSVLLQMLFGWSLLVSLIVTAIVAVSYLFWGGFRSDVQTNVLEFFLMFVGFAVILPFCHVRYGGIEFLKTHLPPLHLTWNGGNSIQFILVWFFIALWTLVDPAFHQRCYAAKDGKVAQRGILLSIIFWFLFDAMTATAGLYARAAIAHLDQPMMAYPMLAELVLPPIAKGLFFVGLMATIMASLDTLAFVSAQTLGRDLYGRLRGFNLNSQSPILNPQSSIPNPQSSIPNPKSQIPNPKSSGTTPYTRVGLVVTFVFSVVLSVFMPSVIQMWYTIGTVIIPGLLVPLMAGYFEQLTIPSRYAFLAMLCGWLTSLGWLIAGSVNGNSGLYPLGIEPMYPGLVVSLVWWGIGRTQVRKIA
ncbi:MAG: sodium:solute symporter family protein [Bacteroidota bacterium]|jgi:SSS family solute:Na+ symporter